MIGKDALFSQRLRLPCLVFVLVMLISAASLHNGYFFDDEIYSIRSALSHGYVALVSYINREDAHPPGSYLLEKFLFGAFGSWEAVKFFGAVLNALGLAFFGFLAFYKSAEGARLPLAVLLALSGTTIMWGASIRWYAYFNPVFTATLGILLFSDISLRQRSLILGLSSVVLFYLSYAAFCAVPALLVVHLYREKDAFRRSDVMFLILVGLIGLALCAPQLRIFVMRFVGADNGIQTGSFFAALPQIAITLLVGNAVFPAAIAPTLYAIFIVALGAYFLLVKPKSRLDWIIFAALLVGTLAMVATGIAVKPRNSVFLLPLIFLLIASTIASLPPVWREGAFIVILAFQLIGVVDVVAHRGTIKGGFDTDYNSALRMMKDWKAQCKGRFTVFHHDPPLDYMLEENSIAASSPFVGSNKGSNTFSPGDCIVLVKTYHGYFDSATIDAIEQAMNRPELKREAIARISEDPNAAMKARLAKDPFPTYLIELYDYEVAAPVTLPAWPANTDDDKSRALTAGRGEG